MVVLIEAPVFDAGRRFGSSRTISSQVATWRTSVPDTILAKRIPRDAKCSPSQLDCRAPECRDRIVVASEVGLAMADEVQIGHKPAV